MKVITTTLLIALSLVVSLSLETRMTTGYVFELAVILIGIIVSLGILFGLWIDAEWAYPLAILLFAAATANIVWQFALTKTFMVFAFGLLVNIGGMVLCFVSLDDYQWDDPVEVYDIQPEKTTKRKRR